MNLEFATATRIVFGEGALNQVASIAAGFGKRGLVVIGGHSGRESFLIEELERRNVEGTSLRVSGEPSVGTILNGVQQAKSALSEFVISLGGGSVIDTGKAIAALLTNPGDPLEYLEVVGQGRALTFPAIPFIAIPTTAGTGSEVTRNAVLSVPEKRIKVSLRSALMLPRVAIVDPELTYSVPSDVTAQTGLDALTQLIEPYTCNAPNALIDPLCVDGISRVVRSLARACRNGEDTEARASMSLASLFGGLALANAKLGAVHGLAGILGGILGAPHGAVCARLLPFCMEANVKALATRAPDSWARARYDHVARLLVDNTKAQVQDAIIWLRALCNELGISPLSKYGLTQGDFPNIISLAQKASSMKGNPIPLTDSELRLVLEQAI